VTHHAGILLIDASAGEKVGLVGGKRRLSAGTLPDLSGKGLVRNGCFHWQRAAFRRQRDSAASSEKITSQQEQTDSNNNTEKEFDHGLLYIIGCKRRQSLPERCCYRIRLTF